MKYCFRYIFLFIISNFAFNAYSGEMLVFRQDNKSLGFALKNKIENFYGANVGLLSGSCLDRVLFWQGTWDFTIESAIEGVLKSRGVGRIKTRWGNPDTIVRTTETTTKIVDADQRPHRHFIGKQLPWIREAWIEANLNKVLNIDSECKQIFRAGAFSFKLGRGISLGDAYAVNPGVLGFYSNDAIDQYAFGFLMHGDVKPKAITYDAYFSVLENKSDSLREIIAPIYKNEVGGFSGPYRGFGNVNFVLAGRMQFFPLCNCDWANLMIEPYIFYNYNPEQRVEFPGDASAKLATPGVMVDYVGDRFNWNFEVAFNIGHQSVKGWDRNYITSANRDGYVVLEYTDIKSSDAADAKNALVTPDNKKIVNSSPQGVEFNGQEIYDSGLYNTKTRFRPSYINKLRGFMFVGDVAFWCIPDELRWAGAVAFATGDENPNKDLKNPGDSSVDGIYSGFIPFQEIYPGKYIDSVFILGPNLVPRPLSMPSDNVPMNQRYSFGVSGFTNLVYFGQGLQITPKVAPGLKLRPNIVSYWQQAATKKYDITIRQGTTEYARKYLGTEMNIFVDWNIVKALKAFFVGGIFWPGDHYRDVKGRPLNKDQYDKLLGKDLTNLPTLGNSTAYSVNGGFEYIF